MLQNKKKILRLPQETPPLHGMAKAKRTSSPSCNSSTVVNSGELVRLALAIPLRGEDTQLFLKRICNLMLQKNSRINDLFMCHLIINFSGNICEYIESESLFLHGMTLLHVAVKFTRINIINILIPKFDINILSKYKKESLLDCLYKYTYYYQNNHDTKIIIENKILKITRILLEHNIKLNNQENSKLTTFDHLCKIKNLDITPVIKLFYFNIIASNQEINLLNGLNSACYAKNITTITLLISFYEINLNEEFVLAVSPIYKKQSDISCNIHNILKSYFNKTYDSNIFIKIYNNLKSKKIIENFNHYDKT